MRDFTTLSFGFGSCTEFCPTINGNLKKFGQQCKNLTSIIVSVVPETDNKDQDSRNKHLQTIKGLHQNSNQKIIVLYPKSGAIASQLTTKAGIISNESNPKAHTPKIFIYSPGGTEEARMDGMDDFSKLEEKWKKILAGPRKEKSL